MACPWPLFLRWTRSFPALHHGSTNSLYVPPLLDKAKASLRGLGPTVPGNPAICTSDKKAPSPGIKYAPTYIRKGPCPPQKAVAQEDLLLCTTPALWVPFSCKVSLLPCTKIAFLQLRSSNIPTAPGRGFPHQVPPLGCLSLGIPLTLMVPIVCSVHELAIMTGNFQLETYTGGVINCVWMCVWDRGEELGQSISRYTSLRF
jgi:hypothetical protein